MPEQWSAIKRKRIPCIHYTDTPTDRTDANGKPCSCPAKWLYSCDRHGSCARAPLAARGDVPTCQTCPDYVPDLPGRTSEVEKEIDEVPDLPDSGESSSLPLSLDMVPEASAITDASEIHTRHLAYIILPVSRVGTWQRNLDNLRLRMPLFNGRKVVAIFTKGDSDLQIDPPEAVKDYLRGAGCEFVEIPNEKHLREVKAFLPLFTRIRDTSAPDHTGHATFFAHAKGVTRPYNGGVTVHPWTDIMYHTLLDYWPLVESVLQNYPLAGSFKKIGRGFKGSKSSWHYSGTFYWLRNDAVFSRPDWSVIDQQWWGTESWPGIHWPDSQAGCIFHEAPLAKLNMYDVKYLRNIVLPGLTKWKQQHLQSRTDIGSLTV